MDEKPVTYQACNFCKSRHLKCDGNSPCIQCSLRNQDCVFPPLTKKRIRRARAAEESQAKRAKVAENGQRTASTSSSAHTGPVLLKKEEIEVLMNLQRGAHNCTMEDIIQLAMAQKEKIDAKKQQLAAATRRPNVLKDLSDFSQDSEYDMTGRTVIFAPDYPDEISYADAMHDVFSKRFGMYYPNGVVTVDKELAHAFIRKFNRAAEVKKMLQGGIYELTEAFCYGVFLTAASGAMMRWRLGVEYASRTELFSRALIRQQFGQYEGSVSKVVACVGFLVHFYMAAGLVRCARNSVLFRHLAFTSWSAGASGGTSIAMLYATLAGLTENTDGRLHWTFCTEALPTQLRTPLTEVLHVQLALGSVLAKEEPLPDWNTLTGTPGENEQLLRLKLYRSIVAISESMDRAPQYLYTRHSEAQGVMRQILNGCLALAAFWQGKLEESIEAAHRTIHNILSVDRDILGVWQLFSNAFAVQIAIAFVHRELFKVGMAHIAEAGMGFPITHRILTRLSEQFTHAEQEAARFQLIGNTGYAFPHPGASGSGFSSGGLSHPTSPVISGSSHSSSNPSNSGIGLNGMPNLPSAPHLSFHSSVGMGNGMLQSSSPLSSMPSSPITPLTPLPLHLAGQQQMQTQTSGGSFSSTGNSWQSSPYSPLSNHPSSPADSHLHYLAASFNDPQNSISMRNTQPSSPSFFSGHK